MYFAGYLNVVWQVEYPPFRESGIPEIQDFNVLPRFRRKGIGSRLMESAERLAAERSHIVGIGVGMTEDYGAAQRLYALRGYVPDGRGLAAMGPSCSGTFLSVGSASAVSLAWLERECPTTSRLS